ncbi:MAG: aspartate carbamoyltransferase regulatory subunit, partial [Clostridiaceae bacterium]
MLMVNTIKNGLVIDHIKPGVGLKLYNYLGLNKANFQVALILNVDSKNLGRKDIIKIDNVINLDYTAIGLIDPSITINVIKNEKIVEKVKLKLPEKVVNIIKCKNPRCITSTETYIPHIFHLINKENGEYR